MAIAIRSLGTDGFALYVVIASLVSWVSLAGLGVAPGLTLGVSRAAAAGDRAEEARLFVVAFLLMAAIATLLVTIVVFLGESGVVARQLAGWLGTASGDAATALLWMTVLIAAQLVVVVPEAAQLGLQKQYVTNVWTGVGSAAAVVAMLTVGSGVTSVAAFVVISQAPQVAARAVNGILFVLWRRFLLRPSGLRFREHGRQIISSGVAFAGMQVASYAEFQIGLLILAATGSAASVALGGVIFRGVTLEVALLALVTTPTWPAIAGAIAGGDMPWVRRAHRMLTRGGLVYSGLVAVIVLVAFEPLVGLWTGTRPPDDPALRALLATFLVVNGWAHVNAMTLVGLGALRFTAIVLILEAAFVVVLQLVLVPAAGVVGYVGALAVGAIVVYGPALGLRVRRELSRTPAS